MPSGKAHRKLAVATAPLIVLGGWTVSGFSFDLETWATIGVVTVAYLANPAYLSPDIDLPESSPSNAWKWAEPILWPLQMIIHRGNMRSPLSHWAPMSSVLRLFHIWIMTFIVFLFGVSLVNLVFFGLYEQVLIPFAIAKWFGWWCAVIASPWWWRVLWGICIGDLVHTAADILTSQMAK